MDAPRSLTCLILFAPLPGLFCFPMWRGPFLIRALSPQFAFFLEHPFLRYLLTWFLTSCKPLLRCHLLGAAAVFQSLSHVWLFVTSWTAACQASLSTFSVRSSVFVFYYCCGQLVQIQWLERTHILSQWGSVSLLSQLLEGAHVLCLTAPFQAAVYRSSLCPYTSCLCLCHLPLSLVRTLAITLGPPG